jgi:phenylacetate-CoA ligase
MEHQVVHKDLLNPHYGDWMEFLASSERWDATAIRAYQTEQLKEVLTSAYEHTTGYRALFDSAGILPSDVNCPEDLIAVPFTSKETFRDNLEAFTSSSVSAPTYVTTGGSTGIPFGFYRDEQAFGRELASKAYQYYRIGWKEGDPQMVFRGLPIDTPDHTEFFPEFNELRCSSYYLTPECMEAYRQRAWEYRPEWLRCYPSSGYLFARYLNETGKSFPPLKGILCASENLYDFQKELLRNTFSCRIFSHYGHYELSVLAGFCEYEDTYHVLPQYGFAELIDAHDKPVTTPGDIGEIVATSFIMRATPFIRYRTRDMAVLKGWGCQACGRPYQIWERIEGRMQDFIVTGTGRLISMTAINMHDDIFDDIVQFQFYQEKRGEVVFRYIPKQTCTDQALEKIRSGLLPKFGDDVELYLCKVDDIQLSKRGKFRFLDQHLQIGVGDV